MKRYLLVMTAPSLRAQNIYTTDFYYTVGFSPLACNFGVITVVLLFYIFLKAMSQMLLILCIFGRVVYSFWDKFLNLCGRTFTTQVILLTQKKGGVNK